MVQPHARLILSSDRPGWKTASVLVDQTQKQHRAIRAVGPNPTFETNCDGAGVALRIGATNDEHQAIY